MKRIGFIAGSLGLVMMLGLVMIGRPVLAQNGTSTPQDEHVDVRQVYLDTVAAELGVTAEELEAAMQAGQLAVIDATGEEARLRVENGGRVLPWMYGRGRGGYGVDGVGPEVIRADRIDASLSNIASFLGISEDDLVAELKEGKALVEIAAAHGTTTEELRTFLIQQATEKIDEQLQLSSDSNEAADESTPDSDQTSA